MILHKIYKVHVVDIGFFLLVSNEKEGILTCCSIN